MEFVLIALGTVLVNLLVFWIYYLRTKKIIYKSSEMHTASTMRLLGRIERRLAIPSHGRPGSSEEVVAWAVIATYGRRDLLERTLRSLRTHEPRIHVLVIDNGSEDGSAGFLARAQAEGLVDKVILNAHDDVPQWQKAFSIHQASALLSLEPLTHLVIIDDDVEVVAPFVERSLAILDALRDRGVRLVSLLTDDEQNAVHPTLETVDVRGDAVRIKESFNGAFVFMPLETLEEMGLPPIREGTDNLAAEDWYWSRQLQGHAQKVACVDNAVHLGAGSSKRIGIGERRGE